MTRAPVMARASMAKASKSRTVRIGVSVELLSAWEGNKRATLVKEECKSWALRSTEARRSFAATSNYGKNRGSNKQSTRHGVSETREENQRNVLVFVVMLLPFQQQKLLTPCSKSSRSSPWT